MSNISNVSANVSLVKKSYKKLVALGEGAKGDDFRMTVENYSNLEFLVQSTQLPALKREPVETKGPHGVLFNQQGNFMNAQDITITFKEVITGVLLEALRDWVKNKRYLKVQLALISESEPISNSDNTVTLEDCWIELDGIDLSVDDSTTIVKPNGTLHANWVSWLDDSQTTVSWS